MVTLAHEDVLHEFAQLINLDANELDLWLRTPESQTVGHRPGESDETFGHRSGRRIVDLLRHDQPTQFDEADIGLMRTVIDSLHQQLAQRPRGDVRDTAWRFMLLNWGHDPLRDPP